MKFQTKSFRFDLRLDPAVSTAVKEADTPNPEPRLGLSTKVKEEPFWLWEVPSKYGQVRLKSRSALMGDAQGARNQFY